ncbi:MAG: amidohydrolase family protein [Roseiarcus sp.]|jgi:2,3-dihydroxybenzoate decarboxylase
MRKIALEEHFTRPEMSAYAQYGGSSRGSPVFEGFQERLLDFGEMRLEAMDRAGIDLAVLSVTTPGVQAEPDTNVAIKRARIENDFLAREITKHPTRYAGFAHLPLQDAAAAADELSRCVEQLEFKGAMVNGHTNGRYLDERSYDPFWERVEALGVPIYLHPRDPFDAPHMFTGHRELSGATWVWTVETATHALRLVFGGVFDRYPKAKLILGHMGETLPYLLWRLDSRWRVQAGSEPIERAPSRIIRDNIFVTTTGVCSHASLLCALSALGEDSVMFSVDYPYEDCEVAAKFIDSAPVSDEVRAKVCHGTARRVLRL